MECMGRLKRAKPGGRAVHGWREGWRVMRENGRVRTRPCTHVSCYMLHRQRMDNSACKYMVGLHALHMHACKACARHATQACMHVQGIHYAC